MFHSLPSHLISLSYFSHQTQTLTRYKNKKATHNPAPSSAQKPVPWKNSSPKPSPQSPSSPYSPTQQALTASSPPTSPASNPPPNHKAATPLPQTNSPIPGAGSAKTTPPARTASLTRAWPSLPIPFVRPVVSTVSVGSVRVVPWRPLLLPL